MYNWYKYKIYSQAFVWLKILFNLILCWIHENKMVLEYFEYPHTSVRKGTSSVPWGDLWEVKKGGHGHSITREAENDKQYTSCVYPRHAGFFRPCHFLNHLIDLECNVTFFCFCSFPKCITDVRGLQRHIHIKAKQLVEDSSVLRRE